MFCRHLGNRCLYPACENVNEDSRAHSGIVKARRHGHQIHAGWRFQRKYTILEIDQIVSNDSLYLKRGKEYN